MRIDGRNTRRALAVGALIAGAYGVGLVSADGAPQVDPLTYSGVLEEDGQLVDGDRGIEVLIFSDEVVGTQLCATQPAEATPVIKGHFSVTLHPTCADALRADSDAWVQVRVDGRPLGRTKIGAVPYALEADHALEADDSLELGGEAADLYVDWAANGTATADRFAFAEGQREFRRVLGATDFIPTADNGTEVFMGSVTQGLTYWRARSGEGQELIALATTVALPAGAMLTDLTCHFNDVDSSHDVAGDIEVGYASLDHSNLAISAVTPYLTSGDPGFQSFSADVPDIGGAHASDAAYGIIVKWHEQTAGGTTDDAPDRELTFEGCLVTYTLAELEL